MQIELQGALINQNNEKEVKKVKICTLDIKTYYKVTVIKTVC